MFQHTSLFLVLPDVCVLSLLWKAGWCPWCSLALFSDTSQMCENQHLSYILSEMILEIGHR